MVVVLAENWLHSGLWHMCGWQAVLPHLTPCKFSLLLTELKIPTQKQRERDHRNSIWWVHWWCIRLRLHYNFTYNKVYCTRGCANKYGVNSLSSSHICTASTTSSLHIEQSIHSSLSSKTFLSLLFVTLVHRHFPFPSNLWNFFPLSLLSLTSEECYRWGVPNDMKVTQFVANCLSMAI